MLLLEMVSNVIQYQYEGNAMLVYSVLCQKDVFRQLLDLRLPTPKTVDSNDTPLTDDGVCKAYRPGGDSTAVESVPAGSSDHLDSSSSGSADEQGGAAAAKHNGEEQDGNIEGEADEWKP